MPEVLVKNPANSGYDRSAATDTSKAGSEMLQTQALNSDTFAEISSSFARTDEMCRAATPNRFEWIEKALTPTRYLSGRELDALSYTDIAQIPAEARGVFRARMQDSRNGGAGVTVERATSIMTNQGVNEDVARQLIEALVIALPPEVTLDPGLYVDRLDTQNQRQLEGDLQHFPLAVWMPTYTNHHNHYLAEGLIESGATLALDGRVLLLTKKQVEDFVESDIDGKRPFLKVGTGAEPLLSVVMGTDIRAESAEFKQIGKSHNFGFIIPPNERDAYARIFMEKSPTQKPGWAAELEKTVESAIHTKPVWVDTLESSVVASKFKAGVVGFLTFLSAWGGNKILDEGLARVEDRTPPTAGAQDHETQQDSSETLMDRARFAANVAQVIGESISSQNPAS